MLKYSLTKDQFDELEEPHKSMYAEAGDGGYQLQVEGIDTGAELKEALRKEREERANAKQRLQEYEQQQAEADRKRMEERQEFEQLYRTETETKGKLQSELEELKRSIAEKERMESAGSITNQLTRDTSRERLLRREALAFIHHTPDGVKINGPDGQAWTPDQLSSHLRDQYPFLVDGNGSSGGGAVGGKGGGAASKKLNEMTGMERVELRRNDPDEYERLRSQN